MDKLEKRFTPPELLGWTSQKHDVCIYYI